MKGSGKMQLYSDSGSQKNIIHYTVCIYLHNGFCLTVWVPRVQDGGILGWWYSSRQVYAHAAASLFLCDPLYSSCLRLVWGQNLPWEVCHIGVLETALGPGLSCHSLWGWLLDLGYSATATKTCFFKSFFSAGILTTCSDRKSEQGNIPQLSPIFCSWILSEGCKVCSSGSQPLLHFQFQCYSSEQRKGQSWDAPFSERMHDKLITATWVSNTNSQSYQYIKDAPWLRVSSLVVFTMMRALKKKTTGLTSLQQLVTTTEDWMST